MLLSTEQLSSEEESSDSGGEGGSDDELARNLETLLGGRRANRDPSHEQEEIERQELRKLLDKPVSRIYRPRGVGVRGHLCFFVYSLDRARVKSLEKHPEEVMSR